MSSVQADPVTPTSRRGRDVLIALAVVAVSAPLLVVGCGGDDGDGDADGDAQAQLESDLESFQGDYTVVCPESVPSDDTEFTCTVTDASGAAHDITGTFNGEVFYFDLNPLGPLTPQQP